MLAPLFAHNQSAALGTLRLSSTVLYGLGYCTVLYCTVLYCTVLYCTVLYCTVLYCTVLYCTVLYCPVLYCTVLYCIVPYCTVIFDFDNQYLTHNEALNLVKSDPPSSLI